MRGAAGRRLDAVDMQGWPCSLDDGLGRPLKPPGSMSNAGLVGTTCWFVYSLPLCYTMMGVPNESFNASAAVLRPFVCLFECQY